MRHPSGRVTIDHLLPFTHLLGLRGSSSSLLPSSPSPLLLFCKPGRFLHSDAVALKAAHDAMHEIFRPLKGDA